MKKALYGASMLITLWALWLVLNSTFSAGHVVLGLALAAWLTWASRSLRPLRARVSNLRRAIRLTGCVALDILRSNRDVMRVILQPQHRRPQAGFIEVPIDLRDAHGLAALACILTYTPGSVWVELTPDGKTLTLHVLDLRSEAEWIGLIKQRYERPLMEIFECTPS